MSRAVASWEGRLRPTTKPDRGREDERHLRDPIDRVEPGERRARRLWDGVEGRGIFEALGVQSSSTPQPNTAILNTKLASSSTAIARGCVTSWSTPLLNSATPRRPAPLKCYSRCAPAPSSPPRSRVSATPMARSIRHGGRSWITRSRTTCRSACGRCSEDAPSTRIAPSASRVNFRPPLDDLHVGHQWLPMRPTARRSFSGRRMAGCRELPVSR